MTAAFSLPEDAEARAATAGELSLIRWLISTTVINDGEIGQTALTTGGAAAAWHRLNALVPGDPNDPLERLRETTMRELVEWLSEHTGIPANYWTDRAGGYVPDSVADAERHDDDG